MTRIPAGAAIDRLSVCVIADGWPDLHTVTGVDGDYRFVWPAAAEQLLESPTMQRARLAKETL